MVFKYRWHAYFEGEGGKHEIVQPEDDKYSKHNDRAEWNPSSFRDFQEYFEEHPQDFRKIELKCAGLDEVVLMVERNGNKVTTMNYQNGRYHGYEGVINFRPIYFRQMSAKVINGEINEPKIEFYCLGFQGNDRETGAKVQNIEFAM